MTTQRDRSEEYNLQQENYDRDPTCLSEEMHGVGAYNVSRSNTSSSETEQSESLSSSDFEILKKDNEYIKQQFNEIKEENERLKINIKNINEGNELRTRAIKRAKAREEYELDLRARKKLTNRRCD